jgi:ABC-type multidrug transport system ATPase subunit
MSMIETNHLTKYYGKARGIIGCIFQCEEARYSGSIGPNGAGKSTTIRLFLSLIYPTGECQHFRQGLHPIRSRDQQRSVIYPPRCFITKA